jgi:hypothetical protein
MSTLGSGVYGLNKINPNGETSQRVLVRASGINNGGSVANNVTAGVQFLYVDSDEYSMAVQNGNGSYSAFRTVEAGMHNIYCQVGGTLATAGGRWAISVFTSKYPVFTSGGTFDNTLSTAALIARSFVSNGSAGIACHAMTSTDIFLEKDTYVFVTMQSAGGSATTPLAGSSDSFFRMSMISTESSGFTQDQGSGQGGY